MEIAELGARRVRICSDWYEDLYKQTAGKTTPIAIVFQIADKEEVRSIVQLMKLPFAC